jgi:hypothetical protein
LKIIFWVARQIFSYGYESLMRRRWLKNTVGRWHGRRGGHAAADQVPACSIFDFKLDYFLYIYSWQHTISELCRSFWNVTTAWGGDSMCSERR